MKNLKVICGSLISIAIICACILCIVNPENYDFAGNIINSIFIRLNDTCWFIIILSALTITAVATAAVFLSLDSIMPVISYIICCVAGLIISGIIAINFLFEQSIVISSTASMWINLIPLAGMLVSIIYATFCGDYTWWQIIVIAIGGIAALLVGVIVCALIAMLLNIILGIFGIILLIAVVIAFFAAISK